MTNKWFNVGFQGAVIVLVGTVILELVRPGAVVLHVPLWWIIGVVVAMGVLVVMTRAK